MEARNGWRCPYRACIERYHVGVVNIVVSLVHGPIFPGRGRGHGLGNPHIIIFNNWPRTILVANDVKMNGPSLQGLATQPIHSC